MEEFNMAAAAEEDEDCAALFSVKLEDIHLQSKRSQQTNLNELVSNYSPKSNGVPDDSHQSFMPSFWPQLFEDTLSDALPDFPHDLTLQNLISDDSSAADFGGNLFNIQTSESFVHPSLLQYDHSQKYSASSSIVSSISPNLFFQSGSESSSPVKEEENGSSKKRARFEKDVSSTLASSNAQSTRDNLEYSGVLDCGTTQSGGGISPLGQSPLIQSFLSSSILVRDHQSQLPITTISFIPRSSTTTTISLTPFLSGMTNRGGMNTRMILIPAQKLPDVTEGQAASQSVITPPQHYFHQYYNHSRSCSTSPEHREEYGEVTNTKEGRLVVDAAAEKGKEKIPRHKRPSHINAEHRRRHKIQSGLEDLNQLLPVQPGGTRKNIGTSKKTSAALLTRVHFTSVYP